MKNTCSLINRSREATEYIIREITHVCRNMKKRDPGSDGEREAAEYMAGILRSECGCSDVRTESFSEHPGAFYGYLYFSCVLDVLCGVAFFFLPWLSIAAGIASLLLFVLQFVLYFEIIDIFFPRKNSINVTAIRPCSGEVKRRVFINGHTDAAWEWPVNYRFGGVAFEAHGVIAVVGVLYYIALSVCVLSGAGSWTGIAGYVGLTFIPAWIGLCFLRNKNLVVDGANDNLTGCYMGIAILKEMEQLGISLENTEVGVILTGSEESGLRGAKAWCRAHRDDFSDVPTYIYSFDTIHDPKFLMVNRKDLNGTLKADEELADLFLRAAEDADIPCISGWVPPMGGAIDSAAFTKGGFRSVAVTGLSHKLESYYHTRKDSWDNLNATGIENCYKAAVRTIELIDAGELSRPYDPGKDISDQNRC